MAEFGVTPEGFVLKRLADIRDDLVTRLNNITDNVTGETLIVNLADANDPIVQIVDSFSDGISAAWEQLQFSYNQFDPLKAGGSGLSGVVQLNGIRRKSGTFSYVNVTLSGQPDQLIPSGKQITDMQNTFIWELPQVVFDSLGVAHEIAICTTKGGNAATAGTLVKILTPVSGWESANNLSDATVGVSEETDAQLRYRQQRSTSATGASVIDALHGSLLALDDVSFVKIYENNTLITDSKGIPGKTVAVVISGGDDDEISLDIFQKQAIGMSTYGSTVTTQTDVQGQIYAISFTRPAEINIFIRVEIVVVNQSVWTTDGPDRIRNAILAYASGNILALGIATGYDRDGYLPGDTVYSSELYVPINSVLGIRITSVMVGKSYPADSPEVEFDWNEIAYFDTDNIDVVVS